MTDMKKGPSVSKQPYRVGGDEYAGACEMEGVAVGLLVGASVGAVIGDRVDGLTVGALLGIETGCADGDSDSIINPYLAIL
jgi:hypothetical protein